MNHATHDTQTAIRALEDAWESGIVKDFESAIPPQAKDDAELLTELALVDLELRIQRDTETRIETYTSAFPQLEQDDIALLELIRIEYANRQDRDSLDAESYNQRFPRLRTQIELMFQLDFNRSGDVHSREGNAQWRCNRCGELTLGKSLGKTKCQSCGEPILIGRYELIERVGQGAFGFVYRALDPKLNREVAVKIPRSNRFLMPEDGERFLRESLTAAQLDHPNIVRVFDAGRHEGVPYIVSEFAVGEPMSEFLRDRKFDFHEAAAVVVEISNAVGHAHEKGIIHRDLKPSNIMADTAGETLNPRVMDFGLARQTQPDVSITLEGQAVGTPAYMSPEQASGHLEKVDQRSDVYSMGVILYQLICGELPFRGNSQRLMQQVVEDDPPSPSRFRNRIPRDLETICMKAINRKLPERYQSAGELSDDLNRWLDGKPIQARRIGAAGVMLRWCRRRPTVAALISFLAISIVAGISGIAWQWQKAEAARMASEADLSDALESVDSVLGHLGSSALADIPQAKQIREEVLNDALVFFQRFQNRNPDDPRVLLQVAAAQRQVASIQNALGKYKEAETAYGEAIKTYQRLQGRAPDKEEWLEQCAFVHNGFAILLSRTGRRLKARAQWKLAFEFRKQLVDLNPKSTKHAAKLATSRADWGKQLSEAKEKEAAFEKSIKELNDLVNQSEKDGYKLDLARIAYNYSLHLSNVGKYSRQEAMLQRAIELYEICLIADPTDEGKQAQYANCCRKLVDSLRTQSRVNEARKYQDKAVEIYRRLTEAFPATPRHRSRFAQMLGETGDLAAIQKRPEAELNAHEMAVRQTETLVALFPANQRYQRQLVDDLKDLYGTLLSANRKSDAEDRMRQSVRLLKTLLDGGTEKEIIHASIGIKDLASLLAKSKSKSKQEEAEALRAEASQLLSKVGIDQIMAANLTNSRKLSLLGSLVTLAKLDDDLETLTDVHRAKIKLYQEGVRRKPKSLSRRSGLAKHWYYLGNTLYKRKLKEESHVAYAKAIEIDEALIKEDPQSATYRSQLLSHSNSLGHALHYSGKFDQATKVIRRNLAIAKELYEEKKSEGFRQIRVASAYTQLGTALAAQAKDFAAALAAFEEALALSDAFAKQPGLEISEALLLNSTAWLLATCPDESLVDTPRALKLATKAVSINPNSATNVSTLAFAQHLNGNHEKAIKTFQQSTQLDADLIALNTLMTAMCYAKLEKIDQANDLYNKAVQLNKANPQEPELFERYRIQAEKLFRAEQEKLQ